MAEIDGVDTQPADGTGRGAEVPMHVDLHHHWRTHIRIHIPVITDPKVLFTCGDETVHMAPGECWIFDSFRFHRVENGWTERRVHLVLDTVRRNAAQADRHGTGGSRGRTGIFVAGHEAEGRAQVRAVQRPADHVLGDPLPRRLHLRPGRRGSARPRPSERIDASRTRGAVWAQFGPTAHGVPAYRRLLAECRAEILQPANKDVMLTNEAFLTNVIESADLAPRLHPRPSSGNVVASVPRQRFAQVGEQGLERAR